MKDKAGVLVGAIDFPYYYSTKFMAGFKTAISGELEEGDFHMTLKTFPSTPPPPINVWQEAETEWRGGENVGLLLTPTSLPEPERRF